MAPFTSNRLVLALICGILGVVGLYYSLSGFAAKLALLTNQSFEIGAQDNEEGLSEEQLILRLLENSQGLTNRFPQTHFIRGQLSERSARLSSEAKDLKYCDALGHFQKAIELSPANATYQIHWAKAAAGLTETSTCSSSSSLEPTRKAFHKADGTSAELAEARLNWARRLEPINSASLYLASLTNRRLGRKAESLQLLREVERLSPVFSAEQGSFFFRLIETKEDLELAIPREYPDVIDWVLHFSSNRPSDYKAWEPEFAQALTDSFVDLEKKILENPGIFDSIPKHIKTTDSLPIVSRNDTLRRQLDKVLSSIYLRENNREWAQFLLSRANLFRIPVVKSYLRKDILPRETMLSRWQDDQADGMLQLNRLNSSVGYFVPTGFVPKLVVLRNASRRLERTESSIEVRTSVDNELFEIFRPTEAVKSFTVDKKEILVLISPEAEYRYVKIRYDNQGADSSFKNRLASLVEVYGEKIE